MNGGAWRCRVRPVAAHLTTVSVHHTNRELPRQAHSTSSSPNPPPIKNNTETGGKHLGLEHPGQHAATLHATAKTQHRRTSKLASHNENDRLTLELAGRQCLPGSSRRSQAGMVVTTIPPRSPPTHTHNRSPWATLASTKPLLPQNGHLSTVRP